MSNRIPAFLLRTLALLLAGTAGTLWAQAPAPARPNAPSGASTPGSAGGGAGAGEEGQRLYPYQQAAPSLEAPRVLPFTPEGFGRPDAGAAQDENRALDAEIKALKAAEKGPRRFAQDLFDLRRYAPYGTEGGVPDDYVLGTGDVLQLYTFGGLPMEAPLRVDGQGEVVIPKVGKVKVTGRSLGEAKQQVQALLGRQAARTSAELQVVKLREVRVFVYGEVYKPGAFLVSSLNSLVNVLSIAGGPTRMGSFRDIRLVRGGKVVDHLDLYPLRTEGRGNYNRALQNGDTLFVPLRRNHVLMKGAFLRLTPTPVEAFAGEKEPEKDDSKRLQLGAPTPEQGEPLLVELKDGETAWDAIQFMGGLPPMPTAPQVTLERTDRQGLTSILNLPLDEATLRRTPVFAEDVITALQSIRTPDGVVEVAGYARVPGKFAWRAGLTLKALIQEQNQLLPDTYLGRAEVLRTHDDGHQELLVRDLGRALKGEAGQDLALVGRDRLTFYPIQDLRQKATVTANGPFSKAGTFEWFEGMRVSDLLFRAGLPDPGANRYYAELAPFDAGRKTAVVPLDLSKLLSTEKDSPASLQDDRLNPRVHPFDTLTLYERPNFRLHHQVVIQGQVERPGPYILDKPRTTLREILTRAGGLTQDAMARGGIFLRRSGHSDKDIQEGLKESQIRQKDPTGMGVMEILERLSETKRQPTTGQLLKNPILNGLQGGSLTRLVIDFEAVLKGDDTQDIELQDGDEILIPRKTEVAYIIGETASPFSAYKIRPGTKVKDLIQLAGGLTRNADRVNVRLLKADGRILDSWVMQRGVEPGDAVLVPQEIRRDTTWQENLNALTPIALILNAIK